MKRKDLLGVVALRKKNIMVRVFLEGKKKEREREREQRIEIESEKRRPPVLDGPLFKRIQ